MAVQEIEEPQPAPGRARLPALVAYLEPGDALYLWKGAAPARFTGQTAVQYARTARTTSRARQQTRAPRCGPRSSATSSRFAQRGTVTSVGGRMKAADAEKAGGADAVGASMTRRTARAGLVTCSFPVARSGAR
jgi:hypothetical protein